MDHSKGKGGIILRMWGRDLLYFVCLIIPRKYLAYNKHSKNTCWMKMNEWTITFSSVQLLSRVPLFATPWIAARQDSLSITTPRVHSNSCPLSQWCHPTILSSVVPLSSCLQSFPASGSFQMSQFLASGGQRTGVNISPSSEYSGLISFRMDWLDLLAVQGTLKILLQHHTLWKPTPTL